MEVRELYVLEEKVQTLLDYCRALEVEKARLEEDLAERNNRIEELQVQVDSMRQERETVKGRVSNLISKIDQLGTLIQNEQEISLPGNYKEPAQQ